MQKGKAGKPAIRRILASAAAIPLIAALAILPYQDRVLDHFQAEYSVVIPFFANATPIYQPRTDYKAFELAEEIQENNNSETSAEASATEENVIGAEVPIANVSVETEVIKPVAEIIKKAEPAPVVSKKSFFIIGGCFGMKENAENFAAELKRKGFESKIVDEHKGLYRVCYGAYTTREEAVDKLLDVKEHNSSAWILSL